MDYRQRAAFDSPDGCTCSVCQDGYDAATANAIDAANQALAPLGFELRENASGKSLSFDSVHGMHGYLVVWRNRGSASVSGR
jgi:hypothetical protein